MYMYIPPNTPEFKAYVRFYDSKSNQLCFKWLSVWAKDIKSARAVVKESFTTLEVITAEEYETRN